MARNFDTSIKANLTLTINHLETRTASTHGTGLFFENLGLNTGVLSQGTIAVAATSISIVCTAMIVDAASAASPVGIALRGIRFNPAPGSQE